LVREGSLPRLNYSLEQLATKAAEVRRDVVTALAEHPIAPAGPSLAGADLLTTLFFFEINFMPEDREWSGRDLWHAPSRALSPALAAAMAEAGFFPLRDLLKMGTLDHPLEGFLSSRTPGIPVSGGVEGAGLSVAVGMALASRLDHNPRRVYCLIDDSEVQIGQIWEATMAAAQFELDNLVLVIDLDGKQQDGEIEEIIGVAPLAEKFRDFNWHVLEVEGNELSQLVDAFNRTRSLRKAPTVILSCTTRGHGVDAFEEGDDLLTAESASEALAALGTSAEEWRRRLEAGDGHGSKRRG
jgi:transketolase